MTSPDLPHFQDNLESLNHFLAMPAAWQNIVVQQFEFFINMEWLQTREQIDALQQRINYIINLPQYDAELARELILRKEKHRSFKTVITGILLGHESLTFDKWSPEQMERFQAFIKLPEYKHLNDFLDNIHIDSLDELREAQKTLQSYVDSMSEEEREAIAQQRRSSS